MSLLDAMARSFFWRPRGCAQSLAHLAISGEVSARWDVTREVAGRPQPGHPLLVVELQAGKVIGDLRLAATQQDVVIGGLQSVFGCDDPQSHFALKRRRFRFPRNHGGTALLLGVSNGDNYYHWLLDTLPRWKIFQAAPLPPYDFVLLPALSAPFQDETLDRLNVPPGKRLRCAKNFAHQFDRLLVSAMPFPLEEAAPWACAWTRSLFPETGAGPEKLYLSRRGGGRRRVVNESELEKALAARGFAIIQTDQLTVKEQAVIFSSARCVVAPHGAALANLIFAPAGARVLELFHPQHKNRCYVSLAAACGHHYASLDGEAVNPGSGSVLAYRIDVAATLQMIDQKGWCAPDDNSAGSAAAGRAAGKNEFPLDDRPLNT